MIEFKNVSKSYDKKTVVKNISFKVEKGELVVLIGLSGCGKTTLLRMINKLIKPTSGSIYIDGKNIEFTDEILLRRNIGYVIQQTGLFPHMTIRKNIEIIPRLQKMNPTKIAQNSIALMEMVGLDPKIYLDRYPSELSGGQQQRIGVARAFACDPDIILMDEPFSALDPITRCQLQDEMVGIQAKYKKTIVFVTHDMNEAIKLADKICIINNGDIQQFDTVETIMREPANEFVTEFIGRNRIWSVPELIKIEDVMITDPICAPPELSVLKCIEKMRGNKIDHILITDKNKILLGILSAKKAQTCADKSVSASKIMNTEFISFTGGQSMTDALETVTKENMSTIPVLKGKELIGLVTRSSLLTAISQQYIGETEDNV